MCTRARDCGCFLSAPDFCFPAPALFSLLCVQGAGRDRLGLPRGVRGTWAAVAADARLTPQGPPTSSPLRRACGGGRAAPTQSESDPGLRRTARGAPSQGAQPRLSSAVRLAAHLPRGPRFPGPASLAQGCGSWGPALLIALPAQNLLGLSSACSQICPTRDW